MNINLFNDNFATGGGLTGAILSRHVELSKYNNAIKLKTKRKCKNEDTALLAFNTAFQELINNIKHSI